jgi:hypothetical protein
MWRKKKAWRIEFEQEGRWEPVVIKKDKKGFIYYKWNWKYTIKKMTAGDEYKLEKAKSLIGMIEGTRSLESLGIDKEKYLYCSMYVPEYILVTHLPIIIFSNGKPETYVFRVPYSTSKTTYGAEIYFHKTQHSIKKYRSGKTGFEYCNLTCGFETLRIDAVEYNSNDPESEEDGIEYVFSVDEIEIEKIEAFENELFSFDIEMPGEDFGIITYSLVSGPHGMIVDPVTGLINWTPDHTQIGENIVTINIEFYESSPVTGGFILNVIEEQDRSRHLFIVVLTSFTSSSLSR